VMASIPIVTQVPYLYVLVYCKFVITWYFNQGRA
jgi:hypothetical protein